MVLESHLMGPAGQLESSESRKLFHGASVITTFNSLLWKVSPKVSPDPMSQLRNRKRSLVTARRICGEAIGHAPGGAKSQAFSSNLQTVLNHTESVFFVLLVLSPLQALLMHRSSRQHFSLHHFGSLTCGS